MKKLILMAAGVLGLAVPAGAGAVTVTPVMSGLANPRGLAFGPDGALYVAESGRGGPGPCVVVMGAQQCAGFTGAVSRLVSLGQQSRIATGPALARRRQRHRRERALGHHVPRWSRVRIRTVADWHPNAPSTEGVVRTSTIGGRGVWRDVATSGLGSRNDAAHTYSAMPGIAS